MEFRDKALKIFEQAHLQAAFVAFLNSPTTTVEDFLFELWEKAIHELLLETKISCSCKEGNYQNCFLNLSMEEKKEQLTKDNDLSFNNFFKRHQRELKNLKKQSKIFD